MIRRLLPDAVSYDPDGVLFDGVSGLPVLYRSSELTDDIYCIGWLSELSDDSFVRRSSIRLGHCVSCCCVSVGRCGGCCGCVLTDG